MSRTNGMCTNDFNKGPHLMFSDRRGRDHMVVRFTTTCIYMQSVPITTKAVSSNPIQAGCTIYNIMW
jgi:hypothetical protein